MPGTVSRTIALGATALASAGMGAAVGAGLGAGIDAAARSNEDQGLATVVFTLLGALRLLTWSFLFRSGGPSDPKVAKTLRIHGSLGHTWRNSSESAIQYWSKGAAMDKQRHPNVVRTWTVERTKVRYPSPRRRS